jgi:hypothetical protein
MKLFDTSFIPKLYRIKQHKQTTVLDDVQEVILQQSKSILEKIKTGDRIGIAAGSRGIHQYDKMIQATVTAVKNAGGIPYIIPAMGSHGGATAEGQLEVLKSYGIEEKTVGAPILSSMETVVIAHTETGVPVYFDRNAYGMDGIILVNRIKPHTDFNSTIESGLIKQMVVGLGKQKGASAIHRRGIEGLKDVIPQSARIILRDRPILMGVAILENQDDRTTEIVVVPAEAFEEKEKQLLERARTYMPSFPVNEMDVLVLQEMGKNISGTGIDPNVVGRYLIRTVPDQKPDIYRIVCLDLTEESHGNAIGVGIADIITEKMAKKIDWTPTYINTITSGFLERGFMPIAAKNDREALDIALNCCNRYVTEENARLVLAKNTLHLKELIVSQALLDELQGREDIEVLGEVTLEWDADGHLKTLF